MRWPLPPLLALLLLAPPPSAAQGVGGPPPGVGPEPFQAAFALVLPVNRADRPALSPRALAELGAVALTGAGHLAFSAADASVVYIPLAMGAWGGYVFQRSRTDPDFLRRVGLTGDRLGPAFRDASLVAAGALGLMAAAGAAQGTLALEAEMLPLLALYPAWGLTQQLLVQGFVAGNLADGGASPWLVVPATAAAFGAVHLPNLPLTAGTAALGLAFTPVYLAHRNVWPLGLYHGALGVAFYYWVLGRSPWDAVAP